MQQKIQNSSGTPFSTYSTVRSTGIKVIKTCCGSLHLPRTAHIMLKSNQSIQYLPSFPSGSKWDGCYAKKTLRWMKCLWTEQQLLDVQYKPVISRETNTKFSQSTGPQLSSEQQGTEKYNNWEPTFPSSTNKSHINSMYGCTITITKQ